MSGELPRPVRVFTPFDLAAADPTSGINRALAFELPVLWAGPGRHVLGAYDADALAEAVSTFGGSAT